MKLLRITPAGEKLLRAVTSAVQRVQQRLLEPLAPADRATMQRLLRHIANNHNDLTSEPLQTAECGPLLTWNNAFH